MFESFKKIDRETWIANANRDLKGKIDTGEMSYHVDNISISPFLTNENVVSIGSIQMPKSKATASINAQAKASALKAAQDGALGIYTIFDDNTDVDLLCDGVYVDMLDWIIEDKSLNQSKSKALTNKLAIDSTAKVITIYSDMTLKAEMSVEERLQKATNVMSSGLIVLELKQDFLAQIAELRALRYYYNAKFCNEENPHNELTIITKCPTHNINIADRQSLITINYMMMSAYIGGSDYVIGLPYGESDDAMARWSTNIQHILDLEAGIGFVQDPTAGSYIIEELTNEFIALLENA